MRFGINLRYDLKRLSDAEIAERLERLLDERQSLDASISPIVGDLKWMYRNGFMYWFGRGPIHSRFFYKLCGGYFGPFKNNPFGTLHRYDCEIKDLRDEIKRRVRRKQAGLEIAR